MTSDNVSAIDSVWEELFNEKHNRKYWKNKKTGEKSWTAPADVVSNTQNQAPANNNSCNTYGLRQQDPHHSRLTRTCQTTTAAINMDRANSTRTTAV